MDYIAENGTAAAIGVWTQAGHVWIKPGATAPVSLDDSQAARARKSLELKSVDAPEVEGATDLHKLSVAALKALAEKEQIDLADVTKKADIISAIELAREGGEA